MNKVCIVGLGYIGLPTASVLATKGYEVWGVDIRPEVVDAINSGKVPIYEPDLDIVLKSAVNSGKLQAGTEPRPADVFILAVPTPFKYDHEPDLSYLDAATRSIAPHLGAGNLVIVESTSPIGTTEQLGALLSDLRPDLNLPSSNSLGTRGAGEGNQLYMAYCPERVLPGRILFELIENDRIIGGIDGASSEVVGEFYSSFVAGEVVKTNSRAAEMAKLIENAYRDVNIAFANELSMISEEHGIDPWEVIRLANHHPRVDILQPGPGVGGHCIAVDPWFIVDSSPGLSKLIRTARGVNNDKTEFVVGQIIAAASALDNPTIACLGLAYKADIDDLRESPAISIVTSLANKKAGTILVVEPHIQNLPHDLGEAGNIRLEQTAEALKLADVVVLLVDHKAFKNIAPDTLQNKSVIDTRGIWH